MAKKFVYKDCLVAASSDLGKALEAKDMKLAEKLYKEANAWFKYYYKDFDVSLYTGAALNAAYKES